MGLAYGKAWRWATSTQWPLIIYHFTAQSETRNGPTLSDPTYPETTVWTMESAEVMRRPRAPPPHTARLYGVMVHGQKSE